MLDRLVACCGRGGLLVTDNVLWNGEVVPGLVAVAARRIPRKRARSPTTTSGLSAHPELHDDHRAAARRRRHLGETVEETMTIDAWLQAAIADAERRGLADLKPLLEALARARARCATPTSSETRDWTDA